MKNTGKPYEKLKEQVFKRLLAQSNMVANVQRDVDIQGRSTKHQIDVARPTMNTPHQTNLSKTTEFQQTVIESQR